MGLLDEAESKSSSGEDAVILISGEGTVCLCSMGEQLLLTSGDGDKL